MPERPQLIRPIWFGPISEVWEASYQGESIVVKRYPEQTIAGPWPAPPDSDLLQKLNHPNIVKFLGCYTDVGQERLYLFERLQGAPLAKAEVNSIQQVLLDTTEALYWLHCTCPSAPRLHGDLSLSNIFVTGAGRAKLLDVSGWIPGVQPDQKEWVHGTREFLSLQRLQGLSLVQADEIFALGRIFQRRFADDGPVWLSSLTQRMTAEEREDRPDICQVRTYVREQVLLHP